MNSGMWESAPSRWWLTGLERPSNYTLTVRLETPEPTFTVITPTGRFWPISALHVAKTLPPYPYN